MGPTHGFYSARGQSHSTSPIITRWKCPSNCQLWPTLTLSSKCYVLISSASENKSKADMLALWSLSWDHPAKKSESFQTLPYMTIEAQRVETFHIVKLRQGSGKERQGMVKGERWKALKPKPLPRAYIKIGCHLPTTIYPPPQPNI